MAVRTPQSETDLAPWVAVAAPVVGAVTWGVWHAPGVGLAWMLVVFACFLSQPPILTGKKDRTGRVQPSDAGEDRRLHRHLLFRQGRVTLLVPTPTSIGWPPLVAAVAAVVAGVAGFTLPLSAPFHAWWPLFAVLDGYGAAMLVLGVPSVFRGNAGDSRPGLDVVAVWRRLAARDRLAVAAVAVGVVASVSAGAILWRVGFPPLSAWSMGALALPAVVQVFLHRSTVAHWKLVARGREEWAPRWGVLKLDPAPRLLDRQVLGDGVVTVDTFDAPPEVGSAGMFKRLDDFVTVVDPSDTVALLDEPNVDSTGQPVPCTSHPTRFRVLCWHMDGWPDVSAAGTDDVLRRLAVESVASRVMHELRGLPPLALEQIAPITDPPSGSNMDWFDDGLAAFGTVWRCPTNPDITIGVLAELGVFDRVAGELGCEVVTDPENDCAYMGALTGQPRARLQPQWVRRLTDLAKIRRWDQRWTDIVKAGGRRPVFDTATEREYVYRHRDASGQVRRIKVATWGFVTPQGVTPAEYATREVEGKLRTTLKAAPFASVQPWRDPASLEGRAHAEAFMVVAVPAGTDLPTLPQSLIPSPSGGNEPQRLLLAGFLNTAFDSCRLGRPQLSGLSAMTAPESRGTIWRMDVFLAPGVTLGALRKQSEKIRQALGAEWLIVDRAGTGRATIVVGANPNGEGVVFADPVDEHREYVTRLNWQQVFVAARVVSDNGSLPELSGASVLPHNDLVMDLDFRLPMGLSPADIRGKVGGLRSASGNGFIDVRESDVGPDHVRMLVCRQNPLPDTVPYDFDLVDRCADSGVVPFAIGIEGEPVIFDPAESPHALLAGVTGAGKSVLAQTFLFSAAAHGDHVFVIDPMKGGADFAFVRPYADAFAGTVPDAAAVLRYVYDQVSRRKDLNAVHGVPSYRDLPDDVRPRRIWVLIDEFTSLMGRDQVPEQSTDPDAAAERERVIALNREKEAIGTFTGKLAREARSAGVTLLLGTQKLSSKLLDQIPGAGDLKVNLARLLLGKASYGDRVSALRNPDDAPELGGSVPRGRGLWEPLVGATQVVQVWYAKQDALSARLEATRRPLADGERPDLSPFRREDDGPRLGVLEEDDGLEVVEVDDGADDPVIEDAGVVEATDVADDLAAFFGGSEAGPSDGDGPLDDF